MAPMSRPDRAQGPRDVIVASAEHVHTTVSCALDGQGHAYGALPKHFRLFAIEHGAGLAGMR
jgi:hypothetical protein